MVAKGSTPVQLFQIEWGKFTVESGRKFTTAEWRVLPQREDYNLPLLGMHRKSMEFCLEQASLAYTFNQVRNSISQPAIE